MTLKPGEVYISEAQFFDKKTIFEYPYLIVDGIKYRQVRALGTGGVVCVQVKKEDD